MVALMMWVGSHHVFAVPCFVFAVPSIVSETRKLW